MASPTRKLQRNLHLWRHSSGASHRTHVHIHRGVLRGAVPLWPEVLSLPLLLSPAVPEQIAGSIGRLCSRSPCEPQCRRRGWEDLPISTWVEEGPRSPVSEGGCTWRCPNHATNMILPRPPPPPQLPAHEATAAAVSAMAGTRSITATLPNLCPHSQCRAGWGEPNLS